MEVLKALIIGIIQGLTEFLPVSSSGHIEIGQAILGYNNLGDQETIFSVVLHLATALSTIVIFRKEIVGILAGLFKFQNNEETRFSFFIVVSMIPAALVGILFEDEIDQFFSGDLLLVGAMLLITGLLLFLADKAKNTEKSVGIIESIVIGISQAIAIMPGISRSGATISTAVLLGIDRTKAAKFSFLMVVPLIFGKIAKDLLDGAFMISNEMMIPLIAGFIGAFFTGLWACKFMIKLVQNSKLVYFSIYCFVVGAIAIAYSLLV